MERLILVLFTAMSVCSVTGVDLPAAFPYTLQEATIKFTKEPQSQSVLTGSTVTLSCNTTIVESNNYRLPELLWRFNGRLLNDSLPPHLTVNTLSGNTKSELTIHRVTQSDSGYYECVVYDGYHVLESGKDAYVTVTSSSRANLDVIDVNVNASREEHELSAVSGGHLLLPCDTGAQQPPVQSSWTKNGQLLAPSQIEVILGNGTLLLLKVNVTSAGIYRCTGHYNDKTLDSATYNVTISEDGEDCSHIAVVDGPRGVVEVGEQLNLTCYATKSQGLSIQWLRNGQVLQDGLSSVVNVYSLPEVSAQDAGSYVCQILSSSTPIARAEVNVTIASKPSVEMLCRSGACHDYIIKKKDIFSPTVELVLTCAVSSPSATVYWYRNGEDITAHSDAGVLTYVREDDNDILGGYQCFAVTPAAVDYDSLRVLRPGFSNPPGNFTCKAIDQISNFTKPSVVLSWERPTLQAYFLDSNDDSVQPPSTGDYVILYDIDGATHTVTVDIRADVNNTASVDLPKDGVYTFYVYFMERNLVGANVAIASCSVNTGLRRITIPRRLNVTCPNTIPANSNNTVSVKWISPQKCPDYKLYRLLYRSICLHGNSSYGAPFPIFPGLRCDSDDDKVYKFEVHSLPPDSVCLFGGFYGIQFKELIIPPETCTIPKSQALPIGKAQLKLSCYNSMAVVKPVTQDGMAVDSTEIHGRCITPEYPLGAIYNYRYLDPGNNSISDLPVGSICSFFGSYRLQNSEAEDFEPVQCVVSDLAPPTSPPTTTVAATTEYSTTTGKPDVIPAPGSGFTLSRAAITWIAVDVSLVFVVIVTVILACFIWKSYSRKVIKERRKQLHFWDDFITRQEGGENLDQDPLVLPQFPHSFDAPDSLSIRTEVDYLYKEEGRAVISNSSLSSLIHSMKGEEKAMESPKLIMDRFLNGYRERVWESSHESLCSVPSPKGQSGGNLSDHCRDNTCDDGDSVPGNSHLTSASQHYTIELQSESTSGAKVSGVEGYIPTGGSSGYGTCSDHYFESGSSVSISATNDYFKSRLADVAECNSLSTCEEEGNERVVEVTNHPRDVSDHPVLEGGVNLSTEVTQCSATSDVESQNRAQHVTLPLKCTGTSEYDGLTRQPTDHMEDNFSTCNNPLDRQGNLSDYSPSTLPTEHYFTDDEGYLRFTKETAV